MRVADAVHILEEWANRGRAVFTKRDLAKLFDEQDPTLSATLNRLIMSGILRRAVRGIYVNALASRRKPYLVEEIAVALRRGEYNYISLESALSEWGAISQIPIDRITVATTGRSGEYRTPFGVIEFTHTKRDISDILANTAFREDRPLRIANETFAARQLRRVGRNVELLDEQAWKEQGWKEVVT